MVKSPSMALSLDDRRRLAAAYDVFARVDARRKVAKRSRKKSKPRDEIKPCSPAGLWGFINFMIAAIWAYDWVDPNIALNHSIERCY